MVGFHPIGKEKGRFAWRVLGGGSLLLVTSVDAEGLTKDDLESPTFGVFAGTGIDILIFFLDLKYDWSLTDVSKVNDFDIGRSRTLYASLGVRPAF